ncbi:hypothetical protein FS837_011209 [Tulasnella sp. UAMH 9824]|nr:hypothetical protein FS837_011209 [Tulasnella sp. UAMH 9824]
MKAQSRFLIRRTPAISFDLVAHPQHVSRFTTAGPPPSSPLSSEPTSASSYHITTRTSSGTRAEGDYYGALTTPQQGGVSLPDIFVYTPFDEDSGRPPNSYCAFRASEQQSSPPTPDLAKLNEALEYLERITEDLPKFERLPGVALDKMVVLPKRKLSVDMPVPGQSLLETEVAAAAALLESSYTAQHKSKSKFGVAKTIKNVLNIKSGKLPYTGAAQQVERAESTPRTGQFANSTPKSGSPHVYHYTLRSERQSAVRQHGDIKGRDFSSYHHVFPPQQSAQFQSFFGFNGSGSTLNPSPNESLPSTDPRTPRRKRGAGFSKLFRKTTGPRLWTGGDSPCYLKTTSRQSIPYPYSWAKWEPDFLSTPPLSPQNQLPDKLYQHTTPAHSTQSLPLQKPRNGKEKGSTRVQPSDADIPPVPPLPPQFVSTSTARTNPLPPPPFTLQPAFELKDRPTRRTASYRKPVPDILSTPPRTRESPVDPGWSGGFHPSSIPANPFSSPLSSLRRAVQSMSPKSVSQTAGSLFSSTALSPRALLNRFSLTPSKRSPTHSDDANTFSWPWTSDDVESSCEVSPIESRRQMMQLDSLHFSDLDFDASKF